MRLRRSLLPFASLIFVHAVWAQCVTSAFPNNYAGTIGVGQGSGVSAADISAAIGMWGECSSYGSGFPTFEHNGNGTWNVSVTFAPGRNPVTDAGCGYFSPATGSGGAVIGGTIVVYEFRGSDGGACGPTRYETIAHELGHFLGLGNSTCPAYIMGGGNGQPGGRSVQADECSRVDQQWETPSEPPPDPAPGDLGNCESPLVLDLNGDGIHTTGIESTVAFDIDGNGVADRVGWTDPSTEEGFLWLDVDANHVVDGGHELFGIGMLMPDGRKASDGFEALRVYDAPAFGGDADGAITRRDQIWGRLRIWVDRNHDGASQASEIGPIQAYGVVSIQLAFVIYDEVEANGNRRQFRSTYTRRTMRNGRPVLIDRAIEDVFFRVHR